MTRTGPLLFDEACARLPLFEELSGEAAERLAAGGLGRGLLTASLRARLRRAGFVDMRRLALAAPADLTGLRKIGPVRVGAIRAHILGELARLDPDARRRHDEDATLRGRFDRLRTVPAETLPLDAAVIARLGCHGGTCADVALKRRAESLRLGLLAQDLDRAVAALVRVLLADRARAQPAAPEREDASCAASCAEAKAREARARTLQAQDREWDEAAPEREA